MVDTDSDYSAICGGRYNTIAADSLYATIAGGYLNDIGTNSDYSAISGVGLFSLRDAYMRLTFGSGLRATAGQFKRPFDVFELTSSTQILVAERGGQVRGVTACGRIATVCSYSNLSAGLLYSDRDLGLILDGALVPGRLQYAVAATNGQTLRQRESNSGKQLTAGCP